MVGGQWLVVSGRWSVVSGLWSVVCGLWSVWSGWYGLGRLIGPGGTATVNGIYIFVGRPVAHLARPFGATAGLSANLQPLALGWTFSEANADSLSTKAFSLRG